MSDVIRLLPDSVANQIAAGEVVQRPASVVKELVENAIDAKATDIQVIIKDAGKTLIQVIDNGKGMTDNDARMCFERHATSKIKKASDLFKIKSMGFRGEAIASIAAVAQVELRTKTKKEELGRLLRVEGSELIEQEPISWSEGTSFTIKNLFYNVPARRNFLKSTTVELRHIIEEFQRVTLAHPEIGFSLYHNGNELYKLSPSKLSHRIVSIFNKNYKSQLIPCEEDLSHLKITGYIGKPEFARKTRGDQYFFVNGRYIKSPYLHTAVMQGYEGILLKDNYPFYVIFIEIDPKHIDINIHPTKTEIKFDDEKTIFSLLRAIIKQSLGTHSVTHSIDFDSNVNFQNSFQSLDLKNSFESESELKGNIDGTFIESSRDLPKKESYAREKQAYERFNTQPKQDWASEFENNDIKESETTSPDIEPFPLPEKQKEEFQGAMTFESAANQLIQSDLKNEHLLSPREEPQTPYQFHNKYLVAQVNTGLLVIRQEAAHERIQYEKFASRLVKEGARSQQLLFPITLELSLVDQSLLNEMSSELSLLGFTIETKNDEKLCLKGLPSELNDLDPKSLIEELLEQYKQNSLGNNLNKQDNLARALAKKSAIKEGQKLSAEEIQSIVDQLIKCANSRFTPEGKLIYKIMPLHDIAMLFNDLTMD